MKEGPINEPFCLQSMWRVKSLMDATKLAKHDPGVLLKIKVRCRMSLFQNIPSSVANNSRRGMV